MDPGPPHFIAALVDYPAPERGYEITFYPLCNPTGYKDGTRCNRVGVDLNREFWRDSAQPAVKIIEKELREQQFDGIIALHADDTSEGLYGHTQGRVRNKALLGPAPRPPAHVLPVNQVAWIDGFPAEAGLVGFVSRVFSRLQRNSVRGPLK